MRVVCAACDYPFQAVDAWNGAVVLRVFDDDQHSPQYGQAVSACPRCEAPLTRTTVRLSEPGRFFVPEYRLPLCGVDDPMLLANAAIATATEELTMVVQLGAERATRRRGTLSMTVFKNGDISWGLAVQDCLTRMLGGEWPMGAWLEFTEDGRELGVRPTPALRPTPGMPRPYPINQVGIHRVWRIGSRSRLAALGVSLDQSFSADAVERDGAMWMNVEALGIRPERLLGLKQSVFQEA